MILWGSCRGEMMKSEPWDLYILKCSDGTLYTGVTKDLKRRIKEHNAGHGARYTRGRGPVKLVYREKCKNHSAALVRECAIKALPRTKKKLIVRFSNGSPSHFKSSSV